MDAREDAPVIQLVDHPPESSAQDWTFGFEPDERRRDEFRLERKPRRSPGSVIGPLDSAQPRTTSMSRSAGAHSTAPQTADARPTAATVPHPRVPE